MERFCYRSYSDLHDDVARWLPHVPVVSAVAGMPRSGLIVASIIAQLRHIDLVPIESLSANPCCPFRPMCSRRLARHPNRPVLIVDDTVSRGRSKAEARQYVTREDVLWGAVYATERALVAKTVDYAGYRIQTPNHSFQWNLLRDVVTRRLAIDFDGVLCPDWHRPSDTGEYLAEYESWLMNVPLMHRPTERVRAIITGRLEKYRRQTEMWLRRHRIEYGELIMHPGDDPAARNSVRHKAHHLKRLEADVCGFVESCPRQSRRIAEATGMAVLCFATTETFNTLPMVPLH